MSWGDAVFVYGSLKAGEANHPWLAGSLSLGRRRLPSAVLHDLGPYPMALLLQPDTSPVLHGELYRVTAAGLARLDELEDYPHEYNRSLCSLSDGSRAWVYHGRPEQVQGTPQVPLGDWHTTPVFHYGIHLDPARLQRCAPRWDGQGLVVRLPGWRWQSHSLPGGAGLCAGIRPEPGSHVWGLISHHPPAELPPLHPAAALHGPAAALGGRSFPSAIVEVRSPCGATFAALTRLPGDGVRADGGRLPAEQSAPILAGLAHWPFPDAWRQGLAAALLGPG